MSHVSEVETIIKKLKTVHNFKDTDEDLLIILLVKKCKELAVDVDDYEINKH